MNKLEKIYEGKAKINYSTDNKSFLIQHFKDDITAFNGKKFNIIKNKGFYNCSISSYIFEYLEEKNIKTHFVQRLNNNDILIKNVDIIPIEFVVRNIVAGSLCKRIGLKEGFILDNPIVEFYYKNDSLNDPMLNEDHINILKLCEKYNLKSIKNLSLEINNLLIYLFKNVNINLIDFKLEFGIEVNNNNESVILLADEISPDSCRLWDIETNKKLDKDIFRFNLGDLNISYENVFNRFKHLFHVVKREKHHKH